MRIAKYIVETLYWERLATLPHLRGKKQSSKLLYSPLVEKGLQKLYYEYNKFLRGF